MRARRYHRRRRPTFWEVMATCRTCGHKETVATFNNIKHARQWVKAVMASRRKITVSIERAW